MKSKIKDLTFDRDGNTIVSFTIQGDHSAEFDKYADKDIDLTIKAFTKRRSLDANAYAWVLIGKIAAALKLTTEEVYRSIIREIGGNSEIIAVRNDAVQTWIKAWTSHGIGWQTEIFNDKRGDGFTDIMCWYGSSVYDSRQMSALLEQIITEAKQLGIETMTPREIAELEKQWEARK
ncbi:MAG TPA: hypothetical protein PLV03_02295 [Clostridiales bacterium]|nr:hypothetical protein [Clostridiales bacterium]